MDVEELYKYAYIKRPLNEVYPDPSLVPPEFIMEWFKDSFDYKRIHSDEELMQFISLKPEEILKWLEEALIFTWEAKRSFYPQFTN